MKNYLFFFSLIFLYAGSSAQVVVNSYDSSHVSPSGLFGSRKEINEIIIPPVDTSQLKNNLSKGIFKSAEPKSVDISPILEPLKEVNGKDFIYRRKIVAQNATSIAITFDKLRLSKNAQLYLYNPEGTIITGPITAKENIGLNDVSKQWSSNSFKGNSVIIELKIPQEEFNQNDLHIFKIRFGLPETLKENKLDSALIGNFNGSSSCNKNMVCPEGNAWLNERKAVCLIESPTRRGSGALIKNTCNTLIPYILTAWHLTNGDNPTNFTFLFGWWSSTCTPNTNTSQSLLFNGSTLRATYEPTDFSLIELNQVPSTNLNLSFLGWDRSSNIPTSTTGIHHPQGDQMKISFDTRPPTIGNVRTYANTAWRTLWTLGTTENGSSGSPLFNQNRLVVGQLFSGTQPTQPPCNQQTGGNNYGRFDFSWTGGGTNATRLSNWLDPNNSGAITTNTANIANLSPAFPSLSISGAALFCTGSSTYTLNGAPAGSTITWKTSDANIGSIPNPSTGTSVSVTRVNAGNIVLTATVSFCAQTYTTTKNIHIGGYSSPDYPISGSGSVYCGNSAYFSTNQLSGATSYTWTYPSGWSASGSSTYSLALQVPSRTTGNYQVSVRVANACDAGGSPTFSYFYVSCALAPAYTVSPNPATNEVTVTSSKTLTKNAIVPSIREVNIYDQLGILRKNQKFSKVPKATVNLFGLSTGVYVIEIVDGTNKVRQKLSILK